MASYPGYKPTLLADIIVSSGKEVVLNIELEESTLAIAERVAKTPSDLQQINKRAVHRQMDAMGIRAGIRAGTEMQQLATFTRTTQAHLQDLRENLTGALSKRDADYGDYRTARDADTASRPASGDPADDE